MFKTRIITLFIVSAFMVSCSAVMATQQPGKKNLAVLTEGAPQSLVRAELGPPSWSGKDEGFDVDVFQFVQGYSKGAKAARSIFHGVADIFTLGLWEIIGTPTELIASGTKLKVTVTYDQQQKVKTVKVQDEEGNEIPLRKKSEE